MPVSVLRYRKQIKEPNQPMADCLHLKKPLRKQTSGEIIAIHSGKVLMGQGYAPGAEVQLLALCNTASKWLSG